MGRLFRFVVSGKSVAELKDNMSRALDELNGEETTAAPAVQRFIDALDAAPEVKPSQTFPKDVPQDVAAPSGVDSMGLPWDERIHSSNMGKNKDGSWRIKRGVEPAFVKQIEHELIARIKAGGVAEAPTFPRPVVPPDSQGNTPPTLPPLQPSAPVTPAPSMGNVYPPPQAPIAPVAVAAPPMVQPIAPSIATPVAPPPVQIPITSAHSLETFSAQFVPLLAQLVSEGKLTQEYIAALKNYFKLDQIYQATDVQKAEMFETFCAGGILTKVGR